MITPKMQTVAIIAVFLFFVMLIWLLRKNRMELRYALLWFVCGLMSIVSREKQEIVRLIQEMAVLEKRVSKLETGKKTNISKETQFTDERKS